MSENYLNDGFNQTPWIPNTDPKRGIKSLLKSIDVIGRPNTTSEPIKRKEMLSDGKMYAEGTPNEKAKILGWNIQTRSMQIALPTEKFDKYARQIREIIANPKKAIDKKELESLVGRLQHVASIIPASKHFMGRLISAQIRAKRFTKLSQNELDDLQIWEKFLIKANQGMDINVLTPRYPDHILVTDASLSKGMGGFNVQTGRAWRWPIPGEWKNMSINLLEFLTTIIALELDIIENKPNKSDCYLIVTDNMSAMGWLYKTNFCESKEKAPQLKVARYLANLLLDFDICLFSQWIQGEKNEVADLLSRDHEHSNKEISNTIITNFPQQVTRDFLVTDLPRQLTLKYSLLVHEWLSEPALLKELRGDMPPIGSVGLNLPSTQEILIRSCKDSKDTIKSTYSQPSCTRSEPNPSIPFLHMASWHLKHAVSTLPAWQRPLYSEAEATQDTIWTENYHDFYRNKQKDTNKQIQQNNNNNAYQ
jgi:hypothetical protein